MLHQTSIPNQGVTIFFSPPKAVALSLSHFVFSAASPTPLSFLLKMQKTELHATLKIHTTVL